MNKELIFSNKKDNYIQFPITKTFNNVTDIWDFDEKVRIYKEPGEIVIQVVDVLLAHNECLGFVKLKEYSSYPVFDTEVIQETFNENNIAYTKDDLFLIKFYEVEYENNEEEDFDSCFYFLQFEVYSIDSYTKEDTDELPF